MNRFVMLTAFALAVLSFACDDLLPDAGGGWTAKLNDYTTWDLTLAQDDVSLTGTLKTTVAQDQAGDSALAEYLPTGDLELTGKIAAKKVVLNKTYDATVGETTVPITLNFELDLNDDNTGMAGTVNFGGIPASKVPEATQSVSFTKK